MIVKNSPDLHKTQPKQHLGINTHSRTHSHAQNSLHTKPYFLQGFQFARQFLVQLKKQKQQSFQYSPITKNNPKKPNEIITEESQKNQSKLSKKTAKIQKFRTIAPEDQINENQAEEQQSIGTMKFKQTFKSNLHSQKEEKKQKSEWSNHHQNQDDDKLFKQKDQITQIKLSPPSRIKPASTRSKGLKGEVKWYEEQINQIGIKLEETNKEIENYEIIFDNVCDCYQANQAIYNRNQKLKRESMRLQEQQQQIMSKIQKVNKESQQLDVMDKKANQFTTTAVQQHVRQICAFNQNQQLSVQKIQAKFSQQAAVDSEENDDQVYTNSLNLNYKKLKGKFEEKQKKKVLPEPKKMQKGVSFEQQIDVITKYYESQLSNI